MRRGLSPMITPTPVPQPLAAAAASPPVFSSRDLMGGAREIIIQHGQEQYRLRLTGSNKLILVK